VNADAALRDEPNKPGGSVVVPRNPKSDIILECHRRADEARRIADAATTAFERADFLSVEERWLSLARSPELWSEDQGIGMKHPKASPTRPQ
jgi:hypothetical protein